MKQVPELTNTVYLTHAIQVSTDIVKVFDFFCRGSIQEHYQALSPGHDYFTIRDGSGLANGAIIDCAETAGNQSIVHEYHVTEVSPTERIAYCSTPSRVTIRLPWKSIVSFNNTYVFYDFAPEANGGTVIRLTIGIQFPSRFQKWYSVLFGGMVPWRKHCAEEMENLRDIIRQELERG